MTEFKYDYKDSSTRVSLRGDERHSAWFAQEDLARNDKSILIHEPILARSSYADGGFVAHWPADELRKHVEVCREALRQLDQALTALQELQYDAYIDSRRGRDVELAVT